MISITYLKYHYLLSSSVITFNIDNVCLQKNQDNNINEDHIYTLVEQKLFGKVFHNLIKNSNLLTQIAIFLELGLRTRFAFEDYDNSNEN